MPSLNIDMIVWRRRFDDAKPFKMDGVYCKLIPLTRGMYAIVNDDDYRPLVRWLWSARLGAKNNQWYAMRVNSHKGKNTAHYMHRHLLGLTKTNKVWVDHINGNGLDNRRKNIRVATYSQNMCNRGISSANTSGYKGVYQRGDTGQWVAQITFDKKCKNLGSFPTKEEAAAAYSAAANVLHGEFANTGRI